MSLIYSMLGEVQSFSITPAVADRREGDAVNRWSPYFLTHKHWNRKEVRTINENVIFAIKITLDGCCDHTKTIGGDETLEHYTQHLREVDLLVFGRKTYQLMVP